MTLDAIDQAFLDRWRAIQPPGNEVAPPPMPATLSCLSAAAPPASDPPQGIDAGLVERLLVAGCEEWATLTDEVEAARLAGHRVIAITGSEQGEGRTTLIACLAHTLRSRGREVTILDGGDMARVGSTDTLDGGWRHDKRIILVDAGVWFRPGPIRRSRLMVASLGCDAAILVRRADRPPSSAKATSLAAVGVAVLGEVLTFATLPQSETTTRRDAP